MNRSSHCRTCLAWDELPGEPGRGVCRRRPPTTAVLPVTGDDGHEGVATYTVWPTTDAEGQGCFEHLEETVPPRTGSPQP